MIHLIEQGINIFNSTNEFFTNLCYEYDLKNDKDIALQDRLKLFYPNLSLCDPGCTQKSFDLEKMKANCECQFNDISPSNKDKIKKENAILENLLGDAIDFIDSTNIGVIKCVKKIKKSIFKSYGAYITLVLLIINIILSIIFYAKDLRKLKIYIYNTTQNFLRLIFNMKGINFEPPLKKKKKENKNIENNNKKLETDTINMKNNNKNKKNKKPKNILINNIDSLRILTHENKSFQRKPNSKDNMFSAFKKLNW